MIVNRMSSSSQNCRGRPYAFLNIASTFDDDDDEGCHEQKGFLTQASSQKEVSLWSIGFVLLQEWSRRGLTCCRRNIHKIVSSDRCLRRYLLLTLGTGLLLLMTYRYINSLAGSKPLRWRIDVYPDTRLMHQEGSTYDDLSMGKSCLYRRGRWQCRDCGTSGRTCRNMKPRGDCQAFRRDEWDKTPRSVSEYNPTNHAEMEFRTLSTLGRYHYHSQPQCTVASCFDLSKCSKSNLTIFVNTTGPHSLVDYAVRQHPSLLYRVDRYQDACLSITFNNTYQSIDEMLTAAHWQQTGGRNNLVYDLSRFKFNNTKRLSSDAPISLFHVGYAAVASESLTSAIYRVGYDVVLPLRRQWGRPTATVALHRPRQWLLTFRGTIKDRPQPYYQHRWLAAEYWERDNSDDIFVDVRCIRSRLFGAVQKIYKDYDDRSSAIYTQMMFNSTFGFCPGGSGVGTYRLGEVLSTGTIPVVMHDLVLPLAPEVDWTGCVVRVSEARIVALPDILRMMSSADIHRRQNECWRLLQMVYGDVESQRGLWKSKYRVTFTKAMEIWAARVENALEMRDRLRRINHLEADDYKKKLEKN